MMFIDMQCPLCGRVCGNSRGDFSVSCSSGWTGGIDPADQAAVLGFLESWHPCALGIILSEISTNLAVRSGW